MRARIANYAGSEWDTAHAANSSREKRCECRRETPPGWAGASMKKLFRRLEQRRRTGAELFEQGRFVGLGGGEMTHLDMAIATDFFRDRRKPDRDGVIIGRETAKHLAQHRLVIRDQRTLGSALLRIAEDVEPGAAHALQPGQQ